MRKNLLWLVIAYWAALLPWNGAGAQTMPKFSTINTVPLPGPGRAQMPAAGDFNGDGIADLVVSEENDGWDQLPRVGAVGVLLGNGGGTCRYTATYAAEGGAASVGVGHFSSSRTSGARPDIVSGYIFDALSVGFTV